MKTNHTDEQYQAAIDAACQETAEAHPYTSQILSLENYSGSDYDRETPARLDLLKSALARLPEPPPPVVDGKTPGQVAHAGYLQEGNYGSVDKWEAAAAAVIAAFGNKPQLSTLRPIAEAGEVPAGAVRVRALFDTSGGESCWIYGWAECEGDTHFADIMLPGEFDHKCDAEKPTPETFEAHGKTWTPAVGDVVMLKGGGPKMTVHGIDRDDIHDCWCHWFDGNRSCLEMFPTACLQPA